MSRCTLGGALASWLLLLGYGLDAAAQPPADTKAVTVLVAGRDLAPGTKVQRSDLVEAQVPAPLATASVIRPDSLGYLVDQRLQVAVLKGDLVRWIMFEAKDAGRALDACLQATGGPKPAAAHVERAKMAILQRSRPEQAPKPPGPRNRR